MGERSYPNRGIRIQWGLMPYTREEWCSCTNILVGESNTGMRSWKTPFRGDLLKYVMNNDLESLKESLGCKSDKSGNLKISKLQINKNNTKYIQ